MVTIRCTKEVWAVIMSTLMTMLEVIDNEHIEEIYEEEIYDAIGACIEALY